MSNSPLHPEFIESVKPFFAIVTLNGNENACLYLDEAKKPVKFTLDEVEVEIPENLESELVSSVYFGLHRAGGFICFAYYQEVTVSEVLSDAFVEDFDNPKNVVYMDEDDYVFEEA